MEMEKKEEEREDATATAPAAEVRISFITAKELSVLIMDSMLVGSVVVLDLRPAFRFYASHVKGAVCIGCPPAVLRAQTRAEAIAALSQSKEEELPLDAGLAKRWAGMRHWLLQH